MKLVVLENGKIFNSEQQEPPCNNKLSDKWCLYNTISSKPSNDVSAKQNGCGSIKNNDTKTMVKPICLTGNGCLGTW